jgi:hypothetical protein
MLGILCIAACLKSSTALVTLLYAGGENIVDTEDMFTFVCAMTLQGFVKVQASLIRNIAVC